MAVGIPILLDTGEVIRGPKVLVPADADSVAVTPERLEGWVHDGWVDLRLESCTRWVERFRRIHQEIAAIPEGDTSTASCATAASGTRSAPSSPARWWAGCSASRRWARGSSADAHRGAQ